MVRANDRQNQAETLSVLRRGPAEIVDNSRYDPGTYFVGCLYCGARSDYEHGEENAAELWNGRVESNDH